MSNSNGFRNLGWPLTIVLGIVVVVIALRILDAFSGLIFLIIFSLLVGVIAGRLLRGRGYGFFGNVGLGFAGSIVGNVVLGLVGFGGLNSIPLVGSLLVGVLGAVIFVYGVRFFKDAEFAS